MAWAMMTPKPVSFELRIGSETKKDLPTVVNNNEETVVVRECNVLRHPLSTLFGAGICGFFVSTGANLVSYVMPSSFVPLIPISLGLSVGFHAKELYDVHQNKSADDW